MKAENQSTKTTFKVSFFLKKTKIRKNGNAPIIARISVNGEHANFSTKLEIEPEKWSLETMSVKGRNAESLKINNILAGIKASINKNYHDLQYNEGSVTAKSLKNNFLQIDPTYESLLSLFDKHLEKLNELVSIRQIIYNTYIVYKKYMLPISRLYKAEI